MNLFHNSRVSLPSYWTRQPNRCLSLSWHASMTTHLVHWALLIPVLAFRDTLLSVVHYWSATVLVCIGLQSMIDWPFRRCHTMVLIVIWWRHITRQLDWSWSRANCYLVLLLLLQSCSLRRVVLWLRSLTDNWKATTRLLTHTCYDTGRYGPVSWHSVVPLHSTGRTCLGIQVYILHLASCFVHIV